MYIYTHNYIERDIDICQCELCNTYMPMYNTS